MEPKDYKLYVIGLLSVLLICLGVYSYYRFTAQEKFIAVLQEDVSGYVKNVDSLTADNKNLETLLTDSTENLTRFQDKVNQN